MTSCQPAASQGGPANIDKEAIAWQTRLRTPFGESYFLSQAQMGELYSPCIQVAILEKKGIKYDKYQHSE